VPTKITRPLCHDLFPRTRLYDLLDQLRDKPTLWISGPPGSGKTALVSSYIDQAGLSCIWYQVDAEDGDPATFFYYLAKGAEQTAGKKPHVPPFTAEYYENPLSFTRWYLEQLCRQLASPVIFVFDNYQELPSDSPVHNILETIIGDLPLGIQLIVISRDVLPGAFIRLKLNGKIGTVSWRDLQLTLDESKGILTKLGRVPADSIPLLHEKAAGWVAGLLLLEAGIELGRLTGKEKPVQIRINDDSREEVFQYFASEIFEHQDDKTRNFLLRTSLLPHMTIPIARELSGERKTAEILLTLHRHNYFVSGRPGFKSTYQYHPLFREFLLTGTETMLSQSEQQQLLEKAAHLLQNSGEIEAAAALFIQAESWPSLIKLILAHAVTLNSQGRIRVLSEWIEKIPEPIRSGSPWLLYWLGVCRIFLDPWHSTAILEQAYQQFAEKQDIAGLMLAWSAVINSILFKGGSFRPFSVWIDKFTGLEQYFIQMPVEIRAPVTVSMLYALGLSSIDQQALEKWVSIGERISGEDIDPVSKGQIYNMLIVMYTFRGDLARAYHYLDIFRNFADSVQLPPIGLAQLKNCTACLGWLSGRFDQCEKAGREGLKIAETSGVHIYDHYLLGQLAASALSQDKLETAQKHLLKMAACMERMRPWEQGFFHVLTTWSALLEGNVKKAVFHAETNIRLLPETGTPVNSAQVHLAMALACQADGRKLESRDYFDSTKKLAGQARDRQMEFSLLLSRAWVALRQDNRKEMLVFLRKALALGRAQGYVNGYFWNTQAMEQLCHHALAEKIEQEYVRLLIRTRKIAPPAHSACLENWPWKIKMFTLGRFSLLVDDRPVRFSKKAQSRPMNLLHVLIALGGRNISQEKLADILWPDALGDAAISSLSTTMQRLRKILTIPEAIIVQQSTITLNPRLCWVDIWAFERFISAAETTATKQIDKKFLFLQKAFALYHGLFLQEQGNEYWLQQIRERLQQNFSRISLQIADYLMQKQDYIHAADFLEKAITIDPANENLYQQLMEYYRQARLNKMSGQPTEKNGPPLKKELN
jgi:ATP/maltotriose-dependent transcriptional regulator MalT/DNA-binding SARP family transcriptional activator